jgi:hypothetical protein
MEKQSTILRDVLKFSQKYSRNIEAQKSEQELEAQL